MPPTTNVPALLGDYQENYNLHFSKSNSLVFFPDFVHHINRICRILRQPRGSALLVGVGGSGRQSATRLAAFIQECRLFTIQLHRAYGVDEFREDVKQMILLAGCNGEAVTFYFSDTQIKDESFVEAISTILNSGEIPELLERDDFEKIYGHVRPRCKQLGLADSKTNMYKIFVDAVRDNLYAMPKHMWNHMSVPRHIVFAMSPIGCRCINIGISTYLNTCPSACLSTCPNICPNTCPNTRPNACLCGRHVVFAMSPIGAPFRDRLRMFPALVNCCTIDWFVDYIVMARIVMAYIGSSTGQRACHGLYS